MISAISENLSLRCFDVVVYVDAARSLTLQQTLKEALRVAAAQRQMQKNKAKNNVQTMASNLSLLTPFLIPGIGVRPEKTFFHNCPFGLIAFHADCFQIQGLNTTASTSTSNNTVMYQVPQGVVYTNGEGSDTSSLFGGKSDSSNSNQQFLFPMNSLTLQQNLLQMMSTAALSAQLESGEQSS
ncbi:unnamed protein product [Anisakis simplex]|uniref:Uncharacterized protein n=1 Tax=Anisakis simplex TaxID=6269 RepID=A0A3P6TU07_ANISI|nr:unnamed protein product [Anisakis simplex]